MRFTWHSLLPGNRWSLTPPFHPYRPKPAVYLCCTVSGVASGGRYPPSLPCEARTFLSRPKAAAIICPAFTESLLYMRGRPSDKSFLVNRGSGFLVSNSVDREARSQAIFLFQTGKTGFPGHLPFQTGKTDPPINSLTREVLLMSSGGIDRKYCKSLISRTASGNTGLSSSMA